MSNVITIYLNQTLSKKININYWMKSGIQTNVYGRVLEQKEWSTTTVIYGINLQGDPLQYA